MAHDSMFLFYVLAVVVVAAATATATESGTEHCIDIYPRNVLEEIAAQRPDSSKQLLFTAHLLWMSDSEYLDLIEKSEIQTLTPGIPIRQHQKAITLFYRWQIVRKDVKNKVALLRQIVQRFPLVSCWMTPMRDRNLMAAAEATSRSRVMKILRRGNRPGDSHRRVDRLLEAIKKDKVLSEAEANCVALPFGHEDNFRPGDPVFAKELFHKFEFLKINPRVESYIQLAQNRVQIPYDYFLKHVELSTDRVADFVPFLNLTDCQNIFQHNIAVDRLKQVLTSPLFLMRVATAPHTMLQSFLVDPSTKVAEWNPLFLSVLDLPEFQSLAELLLPAALKQKQAYRFLFVLLLRKKAINLDREVAGKPILSQYGLIKIEPPTNDVYSEEFTSRLRKVPHYNWYGTIYLTRNSLHAWTQLPFIPPLRFHNVFFPPRRYIATKIVSDVVVAVVIGAIGLFYAVAGVTCCVPLTVHYCCSGK